MTVPVSVVIPAHNRADVIGRAVQSAIGQRLAPTEVIVVDDGSADGTGAVAQSLGARVISCPQRSGAAAARNAGVQAARCGWVALLDSDDEWLPHLLETLWPLHEGRAIVAGAALSRWDLMTGRPDRFTGLPARRPVVIDSPAELVPDNVIPNSGTLVDRQLMLSVGGYDTRLRYAEDWDLWMRMLEHGSAVLSPRVVSIYHCHEGQKSRDPGGPQRDHERILRGCAARPWWTESLRERRRAIRMWDELTDGLAAGKRRHALPLAARLALHPVRLRQLATLLTRRWRVRRASRRVGRRGPVAYITTHYPALSHTFILREVEALRRRGVEIATTSVRRAAPEHLITDRDRHAFETTRALLPARWGGLVWAHARAVAMHPGAYLGTLRGALRHGRPGLRGRVWQLFYFAEAIFAWSGWWKLGVRHIHAHLAAVPADVAMLAADFGHSARTGPQSWSFTMHGPTEFWDARWFSLADKVRSADAVVCISDFARSQLMALVDESHWSKLQVVHCGVESERYPAVEPSADGGRIRILCVGRLVPEKGQAVLLHALASLVSRGVDAEVELVGAGVSRGSLESLAGRLGLDGRVVFAGAVGQDRIDDHYRCCDVFCLASFSEGVPVVLMEAMASRRPVVATAIAGVRELVRDRETGIVVSPGRADQLADALAELARDDALRARLAEAGRTHVAECYDVDRSAAQLDRLFAGLVAGR
ncbi:MAG TPA: glycosyltransferase [Solirubrobacteraceae bacterium]|nr:glycosyltransferase [Solirubrobacteraceae bacterium]